MNILLWVVLGAIAGWIAEKFMKSSHGLVENIIYGIIGAFIGDFVFNMFGQPGVTGLDFYSVLVAVIGAMIVIYLGRLIRK